MQPHTERKQQLLERFAPACQAAFLDGYRDAVRAVGMQLPASSEAAGDIRHSSKRFLGFPSQARASALSAASLAACAETFAAPSILIRWATMNFASGRLRPAPALSLQHTRQTTWRTGG